MPKKGTQRKHQKLGKKTVKMMWGGMDGESSRRSPTARRSPTKTMNSGKENETCNICLEEIENDDNKKSTSCKPIPHVFHENCLNAWFATGHSNCPTCRQEQQIPHAPAPRLPIPAPIPARAANNVGIRDEDVARVKVLAGIAPNDNTRNGFIRTLLRQMTVSRIPFENIDWAGIGRELPQRRHLNFVLVPTPWTSRLLPELRRYYIEF